MSESYWLLWENPITREIEILSSREERDRKEKTYTIFMEMVEEITSEGAPWTPLGI